MEEWGLLEDCLRLTHGGKNLFLLDGRTAALRFCHTSKSRVYRVVKRLELKGWLIKAGGGTRNKKTGMYDNTAYRVLQHEDWAKTHACPNLRTGPVPKQGQAPVPDLNTTSPKTGVPPVPKQGHSSVVHPLYKIPCVKPLVDSEAPNPSFSEGQEIKGEALEVRPSSPQNGTGKVEFDFTARFKKWTDELNELGTPLI